MKQLLIDNEVTTTLADFIKENTAKDVEPITSEDIKALVKLKIGESHLDKKRSLEKMQHKIDVYLIAREFTKVLRSWLSREEMDTVVSRNKTKKYQDGSCATHDFCDSNQAMLDAFEKIMGREVVFHDDEIPGSEKQEEEDSALMDAAWNMAREKEFYPETR